MSQVGGWKEMLELWPKELARRGVLVATFGEQIVFTGFSVGEHFVLVERMTPDAVGGRTILVPYDQILAIKFTDVVKPKQFQAFGFETTSTPRVG